MSGDWKADLERILVSSAHRAPADVIKALCDLGAAMGSERADDLLASHRSLLEWRPELRRVAYALYVGNEIAQSRRFLQEIGSPDFASIADTLSKRIYGRSADMFEHIDFQHCKRAVLVGCGWVPGTLFHIHDRTHVPELVGLDVVPDAVETANRLARHLGYERVRAEVHDGLSYDYGEAQMVYVVSMASPKAAIISRIADTAPDSVHVLVREPFSLGHLWQDAVEPSLDPRFEVFGRGEGRGFLTRDLYLKRRLVPSSEADQCERSIA